MWSILKQCHIFRRNNIIQHVFNQSNRFPPINCQLYPMGTECKSSGSRKNITYKPYVAACYKDHDFKNMTLKRPMSPHLTVYVPTLPAMTSILQRITGAILTAYALLLASGTLFLSNGIDTYVSMIQSLDLSRPSIFFIKLILGFPFCFHYFGGIRFAAWNAGRWLQLKDVYDTAYKCLIASSIMTFLWALL